MENKTQEQIEEEMLELNSQFGEFLHTKGIRAKFKLAFSNMADSARAQKQQDKENFKKIKEKSAEENKEFVEFLHTKGLKAKFNLVVENIKKGAKEAPQKTAQQIAKAKAQANLNMPFNGSCTAQDLTRAFNQFLKSKGLDGKYTVEISEEN